MEGCKRRVIEGRQEGRKEGREEGRKRAGEKRSLNILQIIVSSFFRRKQGQIIVSSFFRRKQGQKTYVTNSQC